MRRPGPIPLRHCLVCLIACGLALSASSVARAHPAIDRGVEAYEQADFEGALRALAEAEGSGELDRGELLRLLGTRALVHFALDRHEPLERDLTMLASLEPEYDLGSRAPPAVRRAYDRIRARIDQPLGLDVRVAPTPGGARIWTESRGDRAGMVERVELAARTAGGAWRRGHDGAIVVPGLEDGRVEVWARAIGPGGAVLATAGTERSPREMAVPSAGAAGGGGEADRTWLWVGIGGGAAVVATVVVVLAIALRGSAGGNTTLLGPTIDRGAGGS